MVWDPSLSSPCCDSTNHSMCRLGHPTRDLGGQKSDSYPVVGISGYVTAVFEGGSIQPVTVVLRRRIRLPHHRSESGEYNGSLGPFVENSSARTAALADSINHSRSRNGHGGGLACQTC